MRERGSGSVLAAGLLAVLLLAGLALVGAAQVVIARARAETAADAAALAAAPITFPPLAGERTPREVASDLAAVNGAVLVRCACESQADFEPRAVEVVVTITTDVVLLGPRAVSAVSRAEFVP
jgi:secretion/DNA translocation related TadE-like protein